MSRTRTLVVHIHYPETLSYFTDWLDAFVAERTLDVVAANLATPLGRRRLRRHIADVDLVVLLHSVVGDSLAEIRRLASVLDARRGPLVAYVSNEVSLPTQPFADKLAILRELGPDIIGTQLLLETSQWLYAEVSGARVVAMPHALNPSAFHADVPQAQRPLDIGFRGARYLPHVGDDERNRIIDFFASTPPPGLAVDVRTNASYGRKGWAAFLNSTRATIGAESGAVYMRRDDEILDRTEAELGVSSRDLRARARLRPLHRYLPRPVKNALRRGADRAAGRSHAPAAVTVGPLAAAPTPPAGTMSGKCISSRHFDAIGTETCQILLPGRYNDLLQPDVQYLALERDFSNLDEVLGHFRDETARTKLVRGARTWALDGQTYGHRVRALLDAVGV